MFPVNMDIGTQIKHKTKRGVKYIRYSEEVMQV